MSDGIIEFEIDGDQVQVADDGNTLLGTLRDTLGRRSPKDGCSPQGQCGCCTVLVDGQPRVACVTPTRRIAGRSVTTLEGLDQSDQDRWANAFCATGASQCGFCTPGIIVRLAGLEAKKPDAGVDDVNKALAAHLCRCTGWQTIGEAWEVRNEDHSLGDSEAGAERARIEGRTPQRVDPLVSLGQGGFADDTAPADALVAVMTETGNWVVADTVNEARIAAGKVQGRRTTLERSYPIDVPDGDWQATLQTTWVEPGYLETDASWAAPGTPAVTPLANGGAFGSKLDSDVGAIAEHLANEYDRAVRVLYSREDSIRVGAKRPPIAGGIRADGSGVMRVADTPGIEALIHAVAPDVNVELVPIVGPLRTSTDVRGAGWVEALCLVALGRGAAERVTLPTGGWAEATIDAEGIHLTVGAGRPLDPVVLRSYCIGAAHMATSMVRSEALTVDADGVVQDLTVRSFGILRASDMPHVDVEIIDEDGEPTNASDAVFAAVAAATCVHLNAQRWPHG